MYYIMPSVNRNNLTSSFPIHISLNLFNFRLLPFSSSCALSTRLKHSGDAGQCCPFPDFNDITSWFSPFRMMLDGVYHT